MFVQCKGAGIEKFSATTNSWVFCPLNPDGKVITNYQIGINYLQAYQRLSPIN
jgi:hypothetical protein